jgi:hypothetical protein
VSSIVARYHQSTRFISEIQRTINPDYHWNPWPHGRRYPPITEWIMNEIADPKDPHHLLLRSRPLPPERIEDR